MAKFVIADLRPASALTELTAAKQDWIVGGIGPISLGISIVDVDQKTATFSATVVNSVVYGGINQTANF